MRRRFGLYLFLFLFTGCIVGYTTLYLLFPKNAFDSLHDQVPGMLFISSFLGIKGSYIRYDEPKTKSIQDNLFLDNQAVITDPDEHRIIVESDQGDWFTLEGVPPSGKLYSPVFRFHGQVSSGAHTIRIMFHNESRHIAKELLVDDFVAGFEDFSFVVGLHRDSLFEGVNSYTIEVVYTSGELLKKQLSLDAGYERLILGNQTLFLDPHMIPDQQSEDMVWTAKDLAGNDTYYVTYGCDPKDDRPEVLVKDSVDYKVVPACLSFSVAKAYLLLFTYHEQKNGERLYAVDRGSLGILQDSFPLYYTYFGRLFYTVVFYDPLTDSLSTRKAWGDEKKHDVELLIRHMPTNSVDLRVSVYGGTQLEVETRTEKMVFYLYKERDTKSALIHPGTRFQYYRKSWGDRWIKAEEGQVYSLPVRVIAPGVSFGPTFTLDFTTNGSSITVSDGVRRIDIDKHALRKSLRTTQLTDQYTNCAGVHFGAFGDLWGTQQGSYEVWQPIFLLASGLPESGVTLQYNNEPEQFAPDQLFGGYAYHYLRYPNKGLQKGVNTYTLRIKNARGNDICTKKIPIVLE